MERLTFSGTKEAKKNVTIRQVTDKLATYEDFEEIFREKMTDAACDLLSDKEEFWKWLDRNKWIAKKCDEWVRAEEQGLLFKIPCHCKDCIYVNYEGCAGTTCYCMKNSCFMQNDDFCVYAEKKARANQ